MSGFEKVIEMTKQSMEFDKKMSICKFHKKKYRRSCKDCVTAVSSRECVVFAQKLITDLEELNK